MAKTKKPLLEQAISEDIKEIVAKCVTAIKRQSSKETDIGALEKLAKIYSIMAACTREDLKAGVMGNLTDEEIAQLAGEESDDLIDGAGEK